MTRYAVYEILLEGEEAWRANFDTYEEAVAWAKTNSLEGTITYSIRVIEQ